MFITKAPHTLSSRYTSFLAVALACQVTFPPGELGRTIPLARCLPPRYAHSYTLNFILVSSKMPSHPSIPPLWNNNSHHAYSYFLLNFPQNTYHYLTYVHLHFYNYISFHLPHGKSAPRGPTLHLSFPLCPYHLEQCLPHCKCSVSSQDEGETEWIKISYIQRPILLFMFQSEKILLLTDQN